MSTPNAPTAGAQQPLGAPLPAALTALVGRERDAGALHELLRTARCVTVTGAGGSGKTRLAIEVASRVAGDLAQGVAWVELAPLADGELLPGYVASGLGLEVASGDATRALADALREREMLLVLDNCEHVVDAAARFVDALLRESPRLRVLATSREALGVAGERAWLIPALELPGDGAGVDEVARSGAGRLFVERAGEAHVAFALTAENASAVAQICRRLDGLPLAIELAAARVRAMTPAQIASRLDDSFRLLTTGSRAAVPRHRTLRETVDWSHALLDADEQRLLRRLSIFAGDFSLDDAEAVCADAGAADDVLDCLASLVDKSLVVMREAEGSARYTLLETIRQYAAAKLRDAGEDDALARRHAHRYAALIAAAAPHFAGRARREWAERVRRELDHVRAALAWTLAHDPVAHVRLVGEMTWVWYSLGLWAEGRGWLEAAVALPPEASVPRDRAEALFGAGAIAALQADVAAAAPRLREGIALADEVGDQAVAAHARNYLGMTLVQTGAPDAEAPIREALAWFEANDDLYGLRLSYLLLASRSIWKRDLVQAAIEADEAIRVARAFGSDRELGIALVVAAFIPFLRGDAAGAERLVRESLACLRRDPSILFMARGLELLGALAIGAGAPLLGARRFGASEAARELLGARSFLQDRTPLESTIAAGREAVGAEAFEAARAAGHGLALDAAVDEVLATTIVSPREASPTIASIAPDDSGHAAPVLSVQAFGTLEIRRDGVRVPADAFRSARPRELLLYLLLHPEGRTREQIGLVFWPESSAAQVKNSFHVALHHLRRALGRADVVAFDDDRYRIAWELGIELDAAVFERDVRAALRRPPDDASATAQLRRAIDRYRGELLAEEGAGDWHLEHRDRLARLFADGARALAERLDRGGDHAAAAEVWRRLVVADALDEASHRGLMASLARAGERAQALRQYERLGAVLRAEGLAPDRRTAELYDRLRRAETV